MQSLTTDGRDPGGTMIAPHFRTGTGALLAVLSVLSRLLPVAFVFAAQLAASSPVRADPVPETMNGVPLLPIPTFEEVGLPPFTMPTGTLSTVPDPATTGGAVTSGGGSGDGADSIATTTMMSQSWGEAASQNAQAVGVTSVSVASTCVMESGCNANPASNGTISGTFQMRDDTYTSMINSALARNPNLAANIVPGLAGKLDPATQSIAAAEYLRQGAVALQQAANLPNPSVLDVRGYYNFGPRQAAAVAGASDSVSMSDVVSLTDAQYRANGIVPGFTTVGQWRAGVTNKIGVSAAQAPVLLTPS